MEKFKIIYPSGILSLYIKHYWILETNYSGNIQERIIPTGYVNLVFHKANQMYSSTGNILQPRSFICGQNPGYTDLSTTGKVNMIVVVFQPYGANAFLDIPINKFYRQNVSINDMENKALKELEDQILNTDDTDECISLIEQYLLKNLYTEKNHNYNRIAETIKLINNNHQTMINNLAEKACLSYKQFNRIFEQYVGTGPKEFSRIVRFQRALYIMQTNPHISLTDLTYKCGYYDQSHLIREFRSFSGYSPSEYISVCMPYSDYFS